MFDAASRYAGIETRTLPVAGDDGEPRSLRYVGRRFIPREAPAAVVEHTVVQGERLDNLTAAYLGDPTQFWRVCDANGVQRPDELTAEPGRTVRIPLPQF
jgi:nucleoid-associated protein YgaU